MSKAKTASLTHGYAFLCLGRAVQLSHEWKWNLERAPHIAKIIRESMRHYARQYAINIKLKR